MPLFYILTVKRASQVVLELFPFLRCLHIHDRERLFLKLLPQFSSHTNVGNIGVKDQFLSI